MCLFKEEVHHLKIASDTNVQASLESVFHQLNAGTYKRLDYYPSCTLRGGRSREAALEGLRDRGSEVSGCWSRFLAL